MYLSLVAMPKTVLRNAYEQHQQLWKLFELDAYIEKKRNFLFRLSSVNRSEAIFLVQSKSAPVDIGGDVRVLQTREYSPKFSEGINVRCMFLINNFQRWNGFEDSKPSRTVIDGKDLTDFVQKRLKGATLKDVSFTHQKPIFGKKGERPITHSCVRVEGVITIDNPEEFLTLVENGIGRAKAMGLGMISLGAL